MNQTQVIEKLQQIFDKIFLDSVILSPSLRADEVDEWDSLMQVILVVAVEGEFQIRFRVGEVEQTQNVGQFADLILARIRDH